MLRDGRHFKVIDFASHDGAEYPFWWEDKWTRLLSLCEGTRDEWTEVCARNKWDDPRVDVISGYRTPAWNAHLIKQSAAKGTHGVASSSQHTQGNAADLRPRNGRLEEFHLCILHHHEQGGLPMLGGIGFYPESNWVHVDTYLPPDGHLRIWTGV